MSHVKNYFHDELCRMAAIDDGEPDIIGDIMQNRQHALEVGDSLVNNTGSTAILNDALAIQCEGLEEAFFTELKLIHDYDEWDFRDG